MESSKNILIVDDDHEIRDLLSQFLVQHGFRTSVAQNGRDMEMVLKKQKIDLIILDIMMPGKSGLTLCQELRQGSDVPIIMLTAVTEDVDRILGLEMGADDYISKPFNPRELLARVKAIFRRSSGEKVKSPLGVVQEVFQFAGWSLDKAKRRLTSPDLVEITVSSGEYDLLVAFLERPQQVLSRDLLLDITKNREAGPYDRSIDIQISRLRHKIEENPKSPQLIKTVRGGGYVLTASVSKE